MVNRQKQIRELAEGLLRANNSSQPPVPIEVIAQACNLIIGKQENKASEISGFLMRQEGHNIIGVNSAHSPERQRFTIAHEIGHFLLHVQGGSPIHIDHNFTAKFRSPVSREGTDKEEREANFFAAEILMPQFMLSEDLKHIEKIDAVDDVILKRLARRYKVSQHSLLLRLTYLGYITP